MASIRRMSFRGRGFICRDRAPETWQALVVDALDADPRLSDPWLRRLRDDWRDQATIGFEGLVETSLDDHAVDEGRRQTLVSLFSRWRDELRQGRRPLGPVQERLIAPAHDEAVVRLADALLWLMDQPHCEH